MKATVLITTKNRVNDLRVAIESVIGLADVEVLVIDDGSTDGTSDVVRQAYPEVTLIHHATSRGYIVRRNEGAIAAKGEIVFSIDDDAKFTQADTVDDVLKVFSNPLVGAATIPYVDVKKSPEIKQMPPDDRGLWVAATYIGTAHAIRKDLFNKLGGYRENFVHQGEEMDYCIRMIDAGYCIAMANTKEIHHFESPKRDFARMDMFGRRNDILFCVYNIPSLLVVPYLIGTTIKGVLHGIRCGRVDNAINGLMNGYRDGLTSLHLRRPVSKSAFHAFRSLKRKPQRISDFLRAVGAD